MTQASADKSTDLGNSDGTVETPVDRSALPRREPNPWHSTPRPWHVYQPDEGVETKVFKHGRTVAARITGATMAVAYTDYGTPERAEANAALIVTAVNSYPALEKCREALEKLRLTARVLLQNSEGCAVNHYGEDFQLHGMPGWLADCQLDIENAESALALLSEQEKGNG